MKMRSSTGKFPFKWNRSWLNFNSFVLLFLDCVMLLKLPILLRKQETVTEFQLNDLHLQRKLNLHKAYESNIRAVARVKKL